MRWALTRGETLLFIAGVALLVGGAVWVYVV
jgi:hypothetical protein